MKPAIDERMAHTRSQLLEVFDAEVHERLRLQRQDTLSHLNQFSRRFWDLTHHVLAWQAWFDEEHLNFDLPAPTAASMAQSTDPGTREVANIPPGRYHLSQVLALRLDLAFRGCCPHGAQCVWRGVGHRCADGGPASARMHQIRFRL